MMANTNTAETLPLPTVSDLRAQRDEALRNMKSAAKALRKAVGTPFEAMAEDTLCQAMDDHKRAENRLRLAESGYEETYPHPAARIHPTDAYSRQLVARGRR